MPRLIPALLILAALMFAAAPFVIDTAPYESEMGLVQRIFYFHVPAGFTMMLSSTLCGIGCAVYLARRNDKADHFALAAAELTVVFGAIVLLTGPLWARKAWGVWWDWEARLTSTLVMWMVFSGYLLLRRFGGPGSEVMSAAVGLFGMVLAPFVYWSVNLWRTMHPKTTVVPTLPATMAGPLIWCLVAFAALYAALLLVRMRLETTRAALDQAYLAAEE